MNLEKLRHLIKNKDIKEAVLQLLNFEQSQLHKSQPRYRERYKGVVEELLNENHKD